MGMSTLNEHLRDKRKGEFAKSVGISPVYLSQILSGYRRPSFDLMVKIEGATLGAVPVGSWKKCLSGVNEKGRS